MAKAALATRADSNLAGRIKSWPQQIKSFYNDVRTEMKKVTTPSMKEVRATTAVVIVTVFIFGVYFAAVDGIIGHTLDALFRYFSNR
jgi:preprotein translocase subunit SecE